MIGIGRQWFRGDGGVGVVSAHLLTVLACLLVMCVQPAQPQRITTPRSTVTFDVVFALDDSSNVPASDWSEMLSLVNGFIDNIAVGFGNARIAVVRYSDDATIAFTLDAYRSNDLVKNAVSALTHSTTGSSQRNLAHAFQVTLTNLLITGERYFAAKVRASFWPVAVTATMPDCDSRCCSTVIRRRTAAGIEVEL